MNAKEMVKKVKERIETAALTAKEKEIVKCRFGIDDGSEVIKTLEYVGEKFGLTNGRVRQIEVKGLMAMRAFES